VAVAVAVDLVQAVLLVLLVVQALLYYLYRLLNTQELQLEALP
jgi:hypothetical protein